MPTAMNVKEEKKAKTNIVRFETSTSPSWKDIKMFIRKNLFSHIIINSEELQHQKSLYRLQIFSTHLKKNTLIRNLLLIKKTKMW